MAKRRKLMMRVLYHGKDEFIRFPVDDYHIGHKTLTYKIDDKWKTIDKSLVREWGVCLNDRIGGNNEKVSSE